MTGRFTAILLITLLSFANQCYANKFVSLKKQKSEKIVLPFKLINNLIVVKMKVNNSSELNFILDTGLKNTIVTELSYNDTIEIKHASLTTLSGLGGEDPVKVYKSTGNTFKFGKIRIENQNLYVMTENVFHISELLGMPIHGIIGHSVLKDYISDINYVHRRIVLYKSTDYDFKPRGKWDEHNIEIINDKPYMYCTIVTHESDTIDVKMLIDTGASQAMWLDKNSHNKISLPKRSVETHLGMGLNGSITGSVGVINNIILGRYNLKNPFCAFPDSTSLHDYTNIDNRNGSIGSNIMRKFRVVIDYKKKKLYLKRNSYYNSKFFFNMSGLEIGTPIPGVPVFEVYNINKTSNAYKAGLRRKDQILSINNKNLINMSLSDINGYIEDKQGRKLYMKVLRDDEIKNITFRLETL